MREIARRAGVNPTGGSLWGLLRAVQRVPPPAALFRRFSV
jgi:hypothetical protein